MVSLSNHEGAWLGKMPSFQFQRLESRGWETPFALAEEAGVDAGYRSRNRFRSQAPSWFDRLTMRAGEGSAQ